MLNWLGYSVLIATGLIFIWLLMEVCDWINTRLLNGENNGQ